MTQRTLQLTPPLYFPNLDFLRFMLALGVLVFHIPEISAHFGLPAYKNFIFLQKGTQSVFWFFVLSGFLLSALAKKEMAQGHFSIRKFFIRRMLRIWPVYYIVVTIGIALYFFILPALHIPFENKASLSTTAFLSYFFLSNILQVAYDPGGILIITWSVSLEEQFYIFFPFFVYLFFVIKTRRILATLVLLIIVIITDTCWPWPVGFMEYWEIYVEFFLIGILASELLPYFSAFSSFEKNILFWISIALLIISFFSEALLLFHDVYGRVFNGLIAAFIILSLSVSNTRVSNPIIRLGGKISYGIYMYHMIVITGLVYLVRTFLNDFAQQNSLLTILLLNIFSAGLTYLVAYLSYITIEKYFLAKKPY